MWEKRWPEVFSITERGQFWCNSEEEWKGRTCGSQNALNELRIEKSTLGDWRLSCECETSYKQQKNLQRIHGSWQIRGTKLLEEIGSVQLLVFNSSTSGYGGGYEALETVEGTNPDPRYDYGQNGRDLPPWYWINGEFKQERKDLFAKWLRVGEERQGKTWEVSACISGPRTS